MQYRIYLLLIINLFLLKCGKSDENTQSQLETDKFYELKSQKVNISGQQIGRVIQMYFIGDRLVLGDIPQKYLYKVYDVKKNIFFEMCKVGEGPNEFKFPTHLQAFKQNDSIKVKAFNSTRVKCEEFDWNKTLAKQEVTINDKNTIKLESTVQNILYLKSIDAIIAVGLFPERYRLIDKQGKILKSFGEYPFQKDFPKISYENLA
ncbi:MAG: hypothetical protein ACK4GN_16365, partial [Runella sp.]